MIYVLLAFCLIGIGLMVWKREMLPVVLLASIPFERIPSADFFGITLRPSTVLFGVAFLILLYDFVMKREKFKVERYWYFLGAYLIAAVVSIISAVDKSRAISVLAFTIYVLVVFGVTIWIAKKTEVDRIIKVILGVAAVIAIFGLYQYLGDVFGLSTGLTGLRMAYTKIVFGFPRVQSTMLEPLYFANYLLLPVVMLLILRLTKNKIWERWQRILTVMLGVVFLLTMSRGAFVAMLVAMALVFIVFNQNIDWKKLGKLGVDLAVVVVITYGLVSLPGLINKNKQTGGKKVGQPSTVKNFVNHTTSRSDGSALDRLGTYKLALEIWKEKPVFGVGVGNFGVNAHMINQTVNNKQIVNNETLELLTETGVVGLAAIFGFLAALMYGVYRTINKVRWDEKAWILAGFAIVTIATMVQYQFFSTLYITHIWVLFGLVAGFMGSLNGQISRGKSG